MSALFKFKKGQPVPKWVESTSVSGEEVESDLHFTTRGKLAVVDGDVYIWPARRNFKSVMYVSNLNNANISGSGIENIGTTHMYFGIVTDGRYWNPSVVAKKNLPAWFCNTVKAEPLPDHFSRASTLTRQGRLKALSECKENKNTMEEES